MSEWMNMVEALRTVQKILFEIIDAIKEVMPEKSNWTSTETLHLMACSGWKPMRRRFQLFDYIVEKLNDYDLAYPASFRTIY